MRLYQMRGLFTRVRYLPNEAKVNWLHGLMTSTRNTTNEANES